MKCKIHPTYKVKRKPTSDCLTCHIMWLTKEVERLKTKLKQEQLNDEAVAAAYQIERARSFCR